MSISKLHTLCRQLSRYGAPSLSVDVAFEWQGTILARVIAGNGQKFILGQNARAPLFAYQTWINVGSKHERPDCTGLAHLFEHLMFKGTAKFAAGVFDREMEARGAQTNAATYVDWTYYTESLASRPGNLATVVEFEADRLQNLQLTQELFVSELEVVKNERRMCVEDAIGGKLGEALSALVYAVHPYREPTIGHMSHLEQMTLEHAKNFYKTYYVPNNSSVVLYGDFDMEEALTLFTKHYGPMPAKQVPAYIPPPEPLQQHPRFKCLTEEVMKPQAVVAFPGPAQMAPEYAGVEILAEILTGGETGRLVERLIYQDKTLSSINSGIASFAEPSFFAVHFTARAEADMQRSFNVIFSELESLSVDLSEEECEKSRNRLKMQYFGSIVHVDHCAEMLGHFETIGGDFKAALHQFERWDSFSLNQLKRLAKTLFVPQKRNVVVVTADENAEYVIS